MQQLTNQQGESAGAHMNYAGIIVIHGHAPSEEGAK
jgi:hypothetical protein